MKGILFKPEVWQGNLRALETYGVAVARRLINPQPKEEVVGDMLQAGIFYLDGDPERQIKPRFHPSETVYIKEAWKIGGYKFRAEADIIFALDGCIKSVSWDDWLTKHTQFGASNVGDKNMRSPMFLPEKYARYFIKIKDVRPERLQEITEEDALREGIKSERAVAVYEYSRLWDSINNKTPWASNPWVWVYTFELIAKPAEGKPAVLFLIPNQ